MRYLRRDCLSRRQANSDRSPGIICLDLHLVRRVGNGLHHDHAPIYSVDQGCLSEASLDWDELEYGAVSIEQSDDIYLQAAPGMRETSQHPLPSGHRLR